MEIGKGSFGIVRHGLHIKSVAIKLIDDENAAIRELAIIQHLNHPSIIKLDSFENFDNYTKLYMKKYPADSRYWRKYVTTHPVHFLAQIMVDISSALMFLHDAGIIYADLKPSNILLEITTPSLFSTPSLRSGVSLASAPLMPRAILCDFNISFYTGVTNADDKFFSLVQTTSYRAPEINITKRYHNYTKKIDVWSFGCTIFELFTDYKLFQNLSEDTSINSLVYYRPKLPMIYSRERRLEILTKIPPKDILQCHIKTLESMEIYWKQSNKWEELAEEVRKKFITILLIVLTLSLNPDPNIRASSRDIHSIIIQLAKVFTIRVDSDVPHISLINKDLAEQQLNNLSSGKSRAEKEAKLLSHFTYKTAELARNIELRYYLACSSPKANLMSKDDTLIVLLSCIHLALILQQSSLKLFNSICNKYKIEKNNILEKQKEIIRILNYCLL